jgi:hypothetical protein
VYVSSAWGSLVAMVVLGGVAAASIMIPVFLKPQELIDSYLSKYCSTHHDCSCQYSVWNTCFNCISIIPCGLVCFSANMIQYGMDQLHDAPMEDSILYIHWYVWTSYAGLLPMEIGFDSIGSAFSIFSLCFMLLLLPLLGVTLCIQRYKRQWFLTDTGSKNPYKLVYRVLSRQLCFTLYQFTIRC